jgi:hypothetical protein
MPLDSACEPVAAFPNELTGDLTVGWPSVIPDATRPDVERFPYPSSARLHDSLLVRFGRWSSRRSGQPRTARPSDDGLKFGQFAGIVQTCSDLVSREIRKFRDNVLSCFTSGQDPSTRPTGIRVPFRRGSPRRISGSLAMWFFQEAGMA